MDAQVKVTAGALFDAPSNRITDVKIYPLRETVGKVKVATLVEALADTLAEVEAEILSNTFVK